MLAKNTGYSSNGSSGITLQPSAVGEDALRVIEGLPENYLETEAFARQRGWVDAINHNIYSYDIVYTADMRAIPRFNEQRLFLSEGRLLTMDDKDACVVSADFLKEHGLSVGDSVSIRLGNLLCHGRTDAVSETEDWDVVPDAAKIPEYTDAVELTIAGAYEEGEGNSAYAPSPNIIYVPSALLPVEVPADYETEPSEFSVFVEDVHDIEDFHETAGQFAENMGLNLNYSDRGWLDVKDSFRMGALASLLTTVLYVVGAALALFLAVYLYIGRSKKSYAIMRMLGVPGKAAGSAVVMPFVAISVLAVPAGGMTGIHYAQGAAEKTLLRMADSAPAGYVPNARLPLSVIALCLLSELLFVSLSAYFFLRSMKNIPPLELLQEGGRPGRKEKVPGSLVPAAVLLPGGIDMAKLPAAGGWTPQRKYGCVRHVAAYVWRNIRRGFGKTAVSLILAAVLAAGIGSFVLARITFRDAFYELSVKGSASDFTFTTVLDLSNSPLVKEFYCSDIFNVRVQGAELDIPMAISSDLPRELGADCTVEYAEGYSLSAFEGTAPICVVGKELAKELGTSAGDDLGILSDILYYTFKAGGVEEDDLSQRYRVYKVIGIVDSEDARVKNGIFSGIRCDQQSLFSMDFPVGSCEFTLADNDRVDELEAILEEKQSRSVIYSPDPSYYLDTGGLGNIERIRGLLESLFPIAVAAAVAIGLFGPLLVILQSAQQAAFLRILGVTKKRARCMLVLEQIVLCVTGIVLVAGGIALYDPGRFTRGIETFAACYGLYLLGCVCGATAAAIQVTRHRLLELLQVKE